MMLKKIVAGAVLPVALALAVGGCTDWPGRYADYPYDGPATYPPSEWPPSYPAPYPGSAAYPGYYRHRHHDHSRWDSHREQWGTHGPAGRPAIPPSPPPTQPAPPTFRQRLEQVEHKMERNQRVFPRQLNTLQQREDRQERKLEQRFDRMEERRLGNMTRRGASEDAMRAVREQLQQREARQAQQLQMRFDNRENLLRQKQAQESMRLEQKRERLERRIESQPPPGGGNPGCGPRKRQRGGC